MKTSFSRGGIITITAETKRENEILFSIINGGENVTMTVAKKERADKGKTHAKAKKGSYTKSCPVEGCPHKAKNMGIHLRMMHGVDRHGEIHSNFNHMKLGSIPVSMPVVRKSNGTLSLIGKPVKTGLLDEPVFSKGVVIN